VPKWWLIPITEENWYIVERTNTYGAPSKSPRKPWKKIRKGDFIIFYIKKKKSNKLGGFIVGVYKVMSDWFNNKEFLWPDERENFEVIYPWKVKIKKILRGYVEFEKLIFRFKFIKDTHMYSLYLRGTPANRGRPLPKEDVDIILKALISKYSM